jgi:DNA-binding response OmpR family regulator
MKHRVLVVDDNADFCEMLKCTLEGFQLAVDVASGGYEALKISAKKKPDLILLDVILPEIDGLSVCEAFRAQKSTEETPIIMITGLRSDLTKFASYEAGADDYLVKPFTLEQLMGRVSHFVPVPQQESQSSTISGFAISAPEGRPPTQNSLLNFGGGLKRFTPPPHSDAPRLRS